MSVCRTSLSVVELVARYKAVSSAKSLTLDSTSSGRSIMYELIPLITTACFRLSKKSFIHFRVSPLKP